MRTLLVPYFVWSILAIVFLVIRSRIMEHYTLNLNIDNVLNSMWIYRGGLVNDPNAPIVAD